ncbi:ABC transporter ATP-binding protein [Clostridium paraputrificum]|uniref:ABC transporter ATP-binding protein n=1 Tax=Clostridium TaxID=1485 RepID=UPI003D349575
MDNILEINNLVKRIGSKNILNGLTFNLDKGKVLGIMGPNGNGKTTLLNIIQGFLRPTVGEVQINGISLGVETKKLVSFLQDNVPYNKSMKIKEAVKFYETFFEDFDRDKMASLLVSMKLDPNMKIRNLSKGMKEKLSLSLTLSRKVKLYMLDEPISGVDPVAREKILDTIIDSISEDSSLIITTHYVGELERIFDEVLFLGDGVIVDKGDAEDMRIKYGMSIDGIYRKLFAE